MTRLRSMRGVALAQVLLALALGGVVLTCAAGWREAGARCAARDEARAVLASHAQALLEWQERHPGRAAPASLPELRRAGLGRAPLVDPWGEPLVYRCPRPAGGEGCDLGSKGPDRLEGTADDLWGWE